MNMKNLVICFTLVLFFSACQSKQSKIIEKDTQSIKGLILSDTLEDFNIRSIFNMNNKIDLRDIDLYQLRSQISQIPENIVDIFY